MDTPAKQKTPARYYHVTKAERLDRILSEGLVPRIGRNSALMGCTEPMVYLAGRRNLAAWIIMLDADAVLEVDPAGVPGPACVRKYEVGTEYMFHEAVPPQYIRRVNTPRKKSFELANTLLVQNSMWFLSDLCYRLLRCERMVLDGNGRHTAAQAMEKCGLDMARAAGQMDMCGRLDFSKVPARDMAGLVREISNGCCDVSFADTYYNRDLCPDMRDSGRRCWEHLANLEVPELVPAAERLHEIIRDNIPYYVRKLKNIGGFWV